MIAEETVENEDLAAEAAAAEAPLAEPTKRTRKPKAEKAPKEPKAPREPKAKKEKRAGLIDKFIKVLVPAAEAGVRVGSGRYQFLEAMESATKVGDVVGKEFQVGDKTVKCTTANVIGMYSRGHVALSADGETWERVQTTVVSE
jgi:hypothetical protein